MIRLYDVLLRLYSREFRQRLGTAMRETFAEELGDARKKGPPAVAALWARTLLRTPFLALEERLRARHRSGRTHSWAVDLRAAARSLSRSPGSALVIAVTVGLGVGAATSLFSVMDALLLRPLPVHEPDRLVRMSELRERYRSVGMAGPRISFERYRDYREATTPEVFSGLAAENLRTLSLRADGPAFSAASVLVSGSYFEVLGVRPELGRFFTRDDEPAVVLGHQLWQDRFGGSRGVLGQTVRVNGEAFTIVGVADREFPSTIGFLHAELWVPWGAYDAAGWPGAEVNVFGRLAAEVVADAAEERASAIASGLLPVEDPDAGFRGVRLEPLTGAPPSIAGPLRAFLSMLLGTALLVLLIAGANVGGMLLARASVRNRELAVRLALGAGRGRLVRQLMLEALLLFAAAGVTGIVFAVGATRLLSRLRFPTAEPVLIDATPHVGALGFAVAIALGAGLLFGGMYAVAASRAEVAPVLRDGGHGATRRGSRTRDPFVVGQVALSVLLLIGAVLFARTAHRSVTGDPGFSPEGVLVAETDLAPHGYDEIRGREFYRRLLERTRALPDVESASLAEIALLTGSSTTSGGWRTHPDAPSLSVQRNVVGADYFETMRMRLVSGRGITEADAEGAPPAIVVNETFARRAWPDGNPLGQVVLRDDRRYQVVGVTRDGHFVGFGPSPEPFAFLASAQQRYAPRQVLHLRTRPGASPSELIGALRGEVAALDPDVAVAGAMPLTTAIGTLLFPQRFAATLIGLFGLLGLVLVATGLYSALAHHVARRTREIGIRRALGADVRSVLGMVLRRGAVLALGGTAIGLGAAALLTRFLQSLLYGVSPLDSIAFVGVPALLCLVALAAGSLPALRALAVDPVEALAGE